MAATTGSTGVVFSVLSALLDYPDPSTQRALPEARTLLNAARALPLDVRAGLDRFIDEYAQRDLMTLQGAMLHCSTVAARLRCTCSSTCMASRVIAARRWSIC